KNFHANDLPLKSKLLWFVIEWKIAFILEGRVPRGCYESVKLRSRRGKNERDQCSGLLSRINFNEPVWGGTDSAEKIKKTEEVRKQRSGRRKGERKI
ncbi:MAG TPA: hypothetical protein VLA60_07465, partial [Nitrospirales bacterium]|nr:hypothetical protein [Nitrospirales bacterium]